MVQIPQGQMITLTKEVLNGPCEWTMKFTYEVQMEESAQHWKIKFQIYYLPVKVVQAPVFHPPFLSSERSSQSMALLLSPVQRQLQQASAPSLHSSHTHLISRINKGLHGKEQRAITPNRSNNLEKRVSILKACLWQRNRTSQFIA